MSAYEPLLGRMTRWFNEVVASDAFRLLLTHREARTVFLDLLGEVAGVDVSLVSRFEREHTISDGRLDLEGLDQQGRPLVIVEAKFDHTMTVDQMARYRSHQESQLAGAVSGVLVLLVPQSRLPEAQGIVGFFTGPEHKAGPSAASAAGAVRVVALSWEQCLDAMAAAVVTLPEAGPVGLAADIAQVRALCVALTRWTTPLTEVVETAQSKHLHVVLEELKTKVPAEDVGPLQRRDQAYTEFRYFRLPAAQGWYAIGLTPVFSVVEDDAEETYVWLRFHSNTHEFEEIKRRLWNSPLSTRTRDYGGHLWLPLDTDPALGGPELVQSLANQVDAVVTIAAPTRPTSTGTAQTDEEGDDASARPHV